MESKKRTLQTMSPLKIGNVEMQNPLVLAPMAGVPDLLRFSQEDHCLFLLL